MFLDKDAVSLAVEIIQADYFYKNSHREIFSAILELVEKKAEVDLISVTNILKTRGVLEEIGGSSYLAEVINSTPPL